MYFSMWFSNDLKSADEQKKGYHIFLRNLGELKKVWGSGKRFGGAEKGFCSPAAGNPRYATPLGLIIIYLSIVYNQGCGGGGTRGNDVPQKNVGGRRSLEKNFFVP